MPAGRMRRGPLLAFAAVAAAVACSALPALAHTTHEGSETLFKGVSGPYELLVTAVPLVDFLEVTVVFAPDTPDISLPYAPRVVVQAERGEQRLGPAPATRALGLRANEYTAVLEPGEAGQWEITVNIDGEPGSATLVLPVSVSEGRGFPWPALAAGLGIVLPILWLAFAPRRKRSGG